MKPHSDMVSIAMCTYNGEAFIGKQIQSILDQTYTNIELIIVDDKSSDRTVEIINSFFAVDRRIKFYQNDQNIGFNKNFEKAIQLTSGAYIAISDQDDIWLPHKIERLIEYISDGLMVYANSEHIDDQGSRLGTFIINPYRNQSNYTSFKSILLENFVTGHNLLFKRESIDILLPIPSEGFYDWWMGFVMLYTGHLRYCNEVLTLYRIHPQSVIRVIEVNSKKSRKVNRYASTSAIVQALTNFSAFKGLTREDEVLLSDLRIGLEEKLSTFFGIKLYLLLFKSFKLYFPGYDKGFSKQMVFLYRYCRGMLWP